LRFRPLDTDQFTPYGNQKRHIVFVEECSMPVTRLSKDPASARLLFKLMSIAFACILAMTVFAQAQTNKRPAYPPSPIRPVTDEYWGIKVTDNYRWLENPADPEVRTWIAAENKFGFGTIDTCSDHDSIMNELKRLYYTRSSQFSSLIGCPNILFAMKDQPPKQQAFLVTLGSVMDTSSARVIVDPNVLDTSGHTTISWYVPSLDGKLVAVCMSSLGSELGTVYLYDVATGKPLSDTVPRVHGPTAGGSMAWTKNDDGFYYTRYPHKGERAESDLAFYQQIYFHKVGTPASQDQYVLGKDFPRIAEIALETSHDGLHTLATVSNGDGGEYAHYLTGTDGHWTQLTQFADRITLANFGLDNALYLLSLKDAPRGKILRMSLDGRPELANTKVFVDQSEGVITGFVSTAQKLYVTEMDGGPSRLRVFNQSGTEEKPVPTEPVSSVGSVLWTAGDQIVFGQSSYLKPYAMYQYDPTDGIVTPTALRVKTGADYSKIEVVREFAISKDGTKIPINILRPKGIKLNGSTPTILYGYGGYGINMTPGFSARNSVWVNSGGVYAIANIRGGGEFGDEWHRAGNLTRKQTVFDDFIACAQYLIKAGYTNPGKLGIEGGSNGGLLMGATLTQRPDLFRAVVSSVGIYDMLRVELSPNGEFNTTEFGSVKNKDEFNALYAYSPFHHVIDSTPYPAVLFVTGENDGRVDPANSRKMTARLQAASSSSNPIILRTSSTAGHGQGTALSEVVERDSDVMTFWFNQLGLKFSPAAQPSGK
jgi:prolyl oligopeptidase